MDQILTTTFFVGLIAATLRIATPLLFATVGEVLTEKSGVLNLGIEGIMFFGAFTGFVVAFQAESAEMAGHLWYGILAAILAGMIMGWLMAFFSVSLGVNQHVAGLGITLLCTALSLFSFRMIFAGGSVLPSITPFSQLDPLANNLFIGPLFKQYLLTYLAFIILIPASWWLLNRTTFGLALRAVGENPEAVDAAGLNVYRIRYTALILGGALMAVGGSFLSLAQLGAFSPGIIAGRGWVSIALVIFARWDPIRAMIGALLFGGVFALQLRLQTVGMDLPFELFLALPYLVTILALALSGKNTAYPGAYLKAYRRE